MRLIPAFEASPKGYADLYQTVLVDTPIGPYFSQFLEQQQERLTNAAQVCEEDMGPPKCYWERLPGCVALKQRKRARTLIISVAAADGVCGLQAGARNTNIC